MIVLEKQSSKEKEDTGDKQSDKTQARTKINPGEVVWLRKQAYQTPANQHEKVVMLSGNSDIL